MRKSFAQFCAFLTDFSVVELQGTGLLDTYYDLLHQVLGPSLSVTFDGLIEAVLTSPDPANQFQVSFVSSSVFWPVVANLISLWYLGIWNVLPVDWYQAQGLPMPVAGTLGTAFLPSGPAYVEQLSYRAAHAHPPGAKPTGYGSWSIPPVI